MNLVVLISSRNASSPPGGVANSAASCPVQTHHQKHTASAVLLLKSLEWSVRQRLFIFSLFNDVLSNSHILERRIVVRGE